MWLILIGHIQCDYIAAKLTVTSVLILLYGKSLRLKRRKQLSLNLRVYFYFMLAPAHILGNETNPLNLLAYFFLSLNVPSITNPTFI